MISTWVATSCYTGKAGEEKQQFLTWSSNLKSRNSVLCWHTSLLSNFGEVSCLGKELITTVNIMLGLIQCLLKTGGTFPLEFGSPEWGFCFPHKKKGTTSFLQNPPLFLLYWQWGDRVKWTLFLLHVQHNIRSDHSKSIRKFPRLSLLLHL